MNLVAWEIAAGHGLLAVIQPVLLRVEVASDGIRLRMLVEQSKVVLKGVILRRAHRFRPRVPHRDSPREPATI
jgi:hypothetical protein